MYRCTYIVAHRGTAVPKPRLDFDTDENAETSSGGTLARWHGGGCAAPHRPWWHPARTRRLARTEPTAPVSATTRPPVGVVGLGVVGSRVVRQLQSDGFAVGGDDASVVVLATSSRQLEIAGLLLERGQSVVTTTDDLTETRALLDLEATAASHGATLVVGASASPGLTGLLAAELARRVDEVDEIHVAFHGTAGPGCARQHHRALGDEAVGWHDNVFISRPGGSGRELLWFPEPVGGKDCYRAALPDVVLLHRAFPQATRISARMSATRRDRLTARLPMMSPPHAEGGIGGVRVEVRGSRNGERRAEVAGAADRTGTIAAAVAASFARHLIDHSAPGVVVAGDGRLDDLAIIDDIVRRGIYLYEYAGSRG